MGSEKIEQLKKELAEIQKSAELKVIVLQNEKNPERLEILFKKISGEIFRKLSNLRARALFMDSIPEDIEDFQKVTESMKEAQEFSQEVGAIGQQIIGILEKAALKNVNELLLEMQKALNKQKS